MKKTCTMIMTILILVTSMTSLFAVEASAASVYWTPRYDTFKWNASLRPSEYTSITRTFTTQKMKKNKKVYIQLHVGYDSSTETLKEAVLKIGKGYGNPSNYYNTIKEKTRFDITVRDANGKIVAQYNNVKYGHVTVFKCPKAQKYTVTVRPYVSRYNAYSKTVSGAAFYSEWSASYYCK